MNLHQALQGRGISFTPTQLARLETYWSMLSRWNRTMNLTALEGSARLERLIVEPLWVLERLRPRGTYVDIGSGNGSPAIPWLICGDFRRGALVEARKKRAVFLHQTCQALALPGCRVHAGRFSDFADAQIRSESASPDWISLQGVKAPGELWRQIKQIRGPQTRIVWLTGRHAEMPEAPVQALPFPDSPRCALVFGPSPSTLGPLLGSPRVRIDDDGGS